MNVSEPASQDLFALPATLWAALPELEAAVGTAAHLQPRPRSQRESPQTPWDWHPGGLLSQTCFMNKLHHQVTHLHPTLLHPGIKGWLDISGLHRQPENQHHNGQRTRWGWISNKYAETQTWRHIWQLHNNQEYKCPPTAGLPVQNGHVVRREDSRGSLFTDPGTPDSMEVKTLMPFWFRQLPYRQSIFRILFLPSTYCNFPVYVAHRIWKQRLGTRCYSWKRLFLWN